MPSDSNPRVAIIVLTMNNYDDTKECLVSLQKVRYPNFDVVVVDNGSVDDSYARLKREFPEVSMVASKENLGFAGGNNLGIEHALRCDPDYMVLLNNDTFVDPYFLNNLVQVAESDPRIGILGAKIFYASEPQKIWYAGGSVKYLRGLCLHLGQDRMDQDGEFSRVADTEFVTGCLMMVRSSILSKIGLLDDRLFLYWEDTDFSMRVQKAGFRCVFVPTAHAWHKISRTSGERSPLTLYYTTRNHLIWVKGHVPYPYKPIALPLAFVRKLLKAAGLTFQNRASAVAVLTGIRDFVFGIYGAPSCKLQGESRGPIAMRQ
jgi:GT2 family glycosyltransferase